MPIPQINIMSVIDVTQALSKDSLKGNLVMMDNSRCKETIPTRGTDKLRTVVEFGEVINWHLQVVDFQTTARISRIIWGKKGNPCAKLNLYGTPAKDPYWAGIVAVNRPIPKDGYNPEGILYTYKFEIEIAGTTLITMETEAELLVRTPSWDVY